MKKKLKGKAVKTSALSFGDIDKYDYLTVNDILPPEQNRLI